MHTAPWRRCSIATTYTHAWRGRTIRGQQPQLIAQNPAALETLHYRITPLDDHDDGSLTASFPLRYRSTLRERRAKLLT